MTATINIKLIINFVLLVALCKLNILYGFVQGSLGKIESSATLSAVYDSKIFGISSSDYTSVKSLQGSNSKLKSEDDFILTFSPALHYSKKIKWFSFGASAGIQLAHRF